MAQANGDLSNRNLGQMMRRVRIIFGGRIGWRPFLLTFGIAMPFVYFTMVTIAVMFHPGFKWMHDEPSELGRGATISAKIYNPGMLVTATAGVLAAIGLLASLGRFRNTWLVAGLTGISLLLGSIGLAFAGLFPLPSPLHYGFGLTTVGVLTPLSGALTLWARHGGLTSLVLFLAFAATVVLAFVNGPPLALAAILFASMPGGQNSAGLASDRG